MLVINILYHILYHYLGQLNSTESLGGLVFNGSRHQRFSFGFSARLSRFSTAHIRFIHLHAARQLIQTRFHHGLSQSMELLPSHLVIAKAQHPLQTQSIDTIFMAVNVSHGPKPKGQRLTCGRTRSSVIISV
jgi:hypothetical protein